MAAHKMAPDLPLVGFGVVEKNAGESGSASGRGEEKAEEPAGRDGSGPAGPMRIRTRQERRLALYLSVYASTPVFFLC